MSSASFFFNGTAPTEIYTLSLHDALPILTTRSTRSACMGSAARRCPGPRRGVFGGARGSEPRRMGNGAPARDRKSTRLNSSHVEISYAVFCLKKKKKQQ